MVAIIMALAGALLVVIAFALWQHQAIATLRYAYWMLAHHTPDQILDRRLEHNAHLMRDAGLKPITPRRTEPHPFYQPESDVAHHTPT